MYNLFSLEVGANDLIPSGNPVEDGFKRGKAKWYRNSEDSSNLRLVGCSFRASFTGLLLSGSKSAAFRFQPAI